MNAGSYGPSGYVDMQREARMLALLGGGSYVPGCYLDFSMAGSALTVRLLAANGQAPSPANPIIAAFHDATASIGKPVIRRVTQPLRLIIPSTATLGFTSATAAAVWFVLFDDVTTQTQRLGVINCLSSTNIYPLGAWPIASATAVSTAADSAHTFYTDAALTSMPYVILGRASWETGLSTAGTWDALPTRVRMHGSGGKLPGDPVQTQGNKTGAVATGSTITPGDDTPPRNDEGDQYMSQAITPSSAANVFSVEAQVIAASAANNEKITLAVHQDTTVDALVSMSTAQPTAGLHVLLSIIGYRMLAGTTLPTTFKARMGANQTTTRTFNGVSGSGLYGGTLNSHIAITEIMA